MRPCQKIYYLVAYYDFEVGNGGLCQYFVNSSKDYVQQTKRYDFDSYDDEFCELKPCENYLVEFARKNISEIWFI